MTELKFCNEKGGVELILLILMALMIFGTICFILDYHEENQLESNCEKFGYPNFKITPDSKRYCVKDSKLILLSTLYVNEK
jgi:hypothetical protein